MLCYGLSYFEIQMAERKKAHETVLLIINLKLNYFSLFHYKTLDIHRLTRMKYIMIVIKAKGSAA